MKRTEDQAVFGPVPSRRLGLSLGVDLVMPKTCTLDCVYCELGRTTRRTLERGRYRDPADVLAQVERRLAELNYEPDYITLAGSGEPTLHLDLGLVLEGLRRLSPARLAVLTNGTLCTDPKVREDLRLADVVIPSLDAVSQEVFLRVNRPAPGLKAEEIVEGLAALCREHPGEVVLETLLVAGLNDDEAELERLMSAAARIAPALVQLNTVVRPPAVPGTAAVEHDRLAELASRWPVPCEVIAPPKGRAQGDRGRTGRQVVEMTRRRPCTAEDVAAMAGLEPDQARSLIRELVAAGRLREERHGQVTFYRGV